MSQDEAVKRQVRVAASPETVFSYFTDSQKMVEWKGFNATLDPRPGGVYRVEISSENVARGEYVEVVPYTKIVFTWGWEGDGAPVPPGSTTVEVTLIPDGDHTIVRLRHYGLPVEAQDLHGEGWDHYMPRLAMAASGGDPGPDPFRSSHP